MVTKYDTKFFKYTHPFFSQCIEHKKEQSAIEICAKKTKFTIDCNIFQIQLFQANDQISNFVRKR